MEEQRCGCKGANVCALCEESERVKGLSFLDRQSVDTRFHSFSKFIFCWECQSSYPIPPQFTFSLDNSQAIFELAHQLHSLHTNQSLKRLDVRGLFVALDVVSEEEEKGLMQKIDSIEWVPSQSGRRKQDYGPKVNFKKQKVRLQTFVGMPDYADLVLGRMLAVSEEKLSGYQPLELCNLEYSPDRGSTIDFHIDDTWIWGERLISVNLLSGSIMTMIREEDSQLILVPMPRRSLLCMYGDIRYGWKHGILRSHITCRRVALTMREPSAPFLPDGDLYEKWGKEMAQRGNQRVPVP